MNSRFIYLVFVFVFMFSACGDINDIQQKYLDEKPVAYLGIADSLIAYSGKRRVKLTWYLNADPRIKQTIIYWNQRNDSIVRNIVRTNPERQKDSVLISVSEGTYTFEVVNRGQNGEVSIKQEVQAQSYGEIYEGSLRMRPLSSITLLRDTAGVKLNWETQPNRNRLGVEVRYRNINTGEWEKHFILEKFLSLELPYTGSRLWHADDIIYASALYLPINSIDTLRTPDYMIQGCHYKVREGKRTSYNAQGGVTENIAYKDISKFIWYTGLNSKETLQANCFGNFGLYTNFVENVFLMKIQSDYGVTVSGFQGTSMNFFNSNRSGDNVSSLDLATGILSLYKMRITTAASPVTTVFEEVLVPRRSEPIEYP